MFPIALEVDSAGTLYVLDAQAKRVHVYDTGGRYVRSLGGEGGGPGEFKQPIGIALAPDGALLVADAGNQRYTVFNLDGSFRETRPRRGHHIRPWPGRFDADGELWDVEQGGEGPNSSPVLVRLPREGGELVRFPLPRFQPMAWRLENGSVQTSAFVPYSPTLVWALTPEGRVWSGISDRYRLALHEPGGDTVAVTDLPLPSVPVTDAERDTAVSMLSWFTNQGGRIEISRIPRNKPAFTAIHVDDQGYVWIRPSLPAGQPDAAFDVLQPDGRYLGRVSLAAPLHELMPVRVRGNRLYTVQLDENDVPSVARYQIEGRSKMP